MDYNAVHGPGLSNFPSSTPHRMPTVSAAQALDDLTFSPTRCISTGIRGLDAILQNKDSSDESFSYGGISRGQITEIHGPPGVGKTTLALQLAASVLHSGESVVWADASHRLSGTRLVQILTSFKPLSESSSFPSPPSLATLLSSYTYFLTPTLAHLIALLSHSTSSFPPPRTSLLVIDSFSALITASFPRDSKISPTSKKSGGISASGSIASRFSILQKLISTLQRLAATRNIAIVVTSQSVTKISPGCSAILAPAINTKIWEQGLRCRLSLLRDWAWEEKTEGWIENFRLARVTKAEGVVLPDDTEKFVGLQLLLPGLVPLSQFSLFSQVNSSAQNMATKPKLSLPHKRRYHALNLEIADSDEENYGWDEEDEDDLPPPPPQWQGSEDLLVGVNVDENEDEDEDERDKELDFSNEVKGDEGAKNMNDNIVHTKKIRLQRTVVENSDSEVEAV
ncbi:putative rad55 protein [Golovinomyces cichoracearum]|uniref:Putative rad55 protein n=1 Tax=Golovinomyces cichoracearum TaxID=62708 RepID=A0A420H7Z3_9PEZI|nr:putative rad55 protein [Golovinomyces cichoracearum]